MNQAKTLKNLVRVVLKLGSSSLQSNTEVSEHPLYILFIL